MFTSFEKNECESDRITFDDNSQGQVLGFGKIAITMEHSISKFLLIESLDYNLLSLSQLCEMGYNCLFTDKDVTVFRRSNGSFAFKGVLRGKLYLVNFIPEEVELDRCIIVKANIGWLWYRRLAHVGMRNIHKLQKDSHIIGLTNIVFEKDRPYGAYQIGKQDETHHYAKNIITTTRPLEMLHMDLFGPVVYISIGDNKYGLVIVDDYSRFTWVFFCKTKMKLKRC
jgi:hypothetical protein